MQPSTPYSLCLEMGESPVTKLRQSEQVRQPVQFRVFGVKIGISLVE